MFSIVRLVTPLLVLLLASCGGLNDDRLRELAVTSPNVGGLVERLAAETGGEMQVYNKHQFAAKINRKEIKPEKFRPVLRNICRSTYKGQLQTIEKNDLLVGHNVPEQRLAQLAGRKGPVTRYLGVALGRSMKGYVVDQNREIERLIIHQNRDLDDMVMISRGVCASYKQGILAIHFVAALFSEDPLRGKAPLFWAITEGDALTASLNKEIDRARTAAQRTMFLEKDTVDHYFGTGTRDNVSVGLEMKKKVGYVDTYRTIFTVTNDSSSNYMFSLNDVKRLRSASGMEHDFALKRSLRDKSTCEFDQVTRNYNIPSGRQCNIDLTAEVSYFTMPDELLSLEKASMIIELKPVSVYEDKYGS